MFKLHHIGCLVESIDSAREHYLPLLGDQKTSEKIHISSQNVTVCFLKMTDGLFLELVEPQTEDSPLSKLIKKGTSFYHLGFMADDLKLSTDELLSKNYKHVESFESEAFENRTCTFFMSPDMQLIELIQN